MSLDVTKAATVYSQQIFNKITGVTLTDASLDFKDTALRDAHREIATILAPAYKGGGTIRPEDVVARLNALDEPTRKRVLEGIEKMQQALGNRDANLAKVKELSTPPPSTPPPSQPPVVPQPSVPPPTVTTPATTLPVVTPTNAKAMNEALQEFQKWYKETYKEEFKVHGSANGGLVVIEDKGILFGKADGTHRTRLTTDNAARAKLKELGFEVLPTQTIKELRLRWTGNQSGAVTAPGADTDLTNATSLIAAIKSGKMPTITDDKQAAQALTTLYNGKEYEYYRQLARDLNKKGLATHFELPNSPFKTMEPSLTDIQVLSIAPTNYTYRFGNSAPSYEVKLKMANHEIKLIAPATMDFDKLLKNVRNGLQDISQTSYITELKTIVIDTNNKPAKWINDQKMEEHGETLADANSSSGTMTFFKLSNGHYDFSQATFQHEMGHLVANRLADKDLQWWQKIVRANDADPGSSYQKLWEKQKSVSKYGNSNYVEGFAEAYSDYMLGGKKLTKEQFELIQSLGIPNTFAAANPNILITNIQK